MKKAVLFVLVFLFRLSAQAATLSLTGDGATGASQIVTVDTGSTVIGQGTVNPAGDWDSLFVLSSDKDTAVEITWTFNKEADLEKATLVFGELYFVPSIVEFVSGSYTFIAKLFAGEEYAVDIVDATSKNVMSYDLNIQAVPVPAAVLLFSPAIFGLTLLRRKLKS